MDQYRPSRDSRLDKTLDPFSTDPPQPKGLVTNLSSLFLSLSFFSFLSLPSVLPSIIHLSVRPSVHPFIRGQIITKAMPSETAAGAGRRLNVAIGTETKNAREYLEYS